MEISIKFSLVAIFFLWALQFCASLGEDLPIPSFGPLVIAKESRRTLVSTDSGSITAVDVQDRYRGLYHLQFITLDTSSLLLPIILHTDMVFYVHSGRGAVNWITEDRTNRIEVRRGDIYRLEEGTVFYVESHPDPLREKLRIHAIFNTMLDENPSEGFVGAYSSIIDLVRGFDDEVLQMAFGVSEEVIQGIKRVERPPPIVHYEPKNETDEVDWREGIFEALIGGRHPIADGKKKKKKEKTKTLNLADRKPDIENCNGRSVAVTSKEFKPLKGSDIGIFMVNLTRGSMMGPHWNPKATEIAIVTHGQGIVQIVGPSKASGASSEDLRCRNTKFKVKEGDIFIVPRYHPMAQISFNNDSFVFMGFTTTASQNHPQFLAGKRSVLRTIDREMLARSFNAANTTIDHLLDSQIESVMFECATCAEELEEKIEEEIERKREEEEARKREEEERKREEEEARRREEEARKREEEEARKREEEEARKREEEARRREEEEARRREEEEDEERKREEEEARKKEEEEARRKEEEEARRREEEERKREEEEARKREEEETRKREEEEARRREEEEARKREEEEEEARKRKEEARKREEEEQRRQEEEARKREEEEKRRREEEEEEQRKEEEEMQKRQEEEAKRQEEEEEEEEEARRREEEQEEPRRREEARREEEEAQEQGEAAAKKTEAEQKQMQAGEEEQEKQAEEEPAY